MSRLSHFERIEQILRSSVALDASQTLTPSTELFALGIDSLTTINVLMEVASAYAVELDGFVDDIGELTTVGDLCALATKFAGDSFAGENQVMGEIDAGKADTGEPTIKFFAEQALHYEYGLDGIRTFPWADVNTPIGSGYCIVRPGTETLRHVNEPADEDELFVGIQGHAIVVMDGQEYPMTQGDQVFIPRGVSHYIRNDSAQPFHFFTVWWNQQGARAYLAKEDAKPEAANGSSASVGAVGHATFAQARQAELAAQPELDRV